MSHNPKDMHPRDLALRLAFGKARNAFNIAAISAGNLTDAIWKLRTKTEKE